MPRRSILLLAGACIVIAAAVGLFTFMMVSRPSNAPAQGEVVSIGEAQIGGPFELVDQDGRAVDQSILDGKWSLVFFGFTYCPDYCPTTLNGLAATQARLGDEAKDLQILFVSIDPERDTPAAMKTYLSLDGYPKGVIGLTGTPAQVKTAADAYRVIYQKVGDGDDYTMNHSTLVYLMGPDGKFRSALQHDLGPDRTAEIIRRTIARG
ncbi:SCO family protein [Brevundimonas sp. NPDC092305]|uniref:SCO family protein n=1 Tax=Brevundimonas sp. NPDC092305 TaxID=3363957 RepID=UPI003821A3C4